MKRCHECGVEKSLDDFHKHSTGKHGRATICKPCRSAKGAQKWASNKGENRLRQRTNKYGITVAQFMEMLEAQDYKCAICGSSDPNPTSFKGENAKVFHIDHDHATGAVRGILCMRCNMMIGYAQDNPEVLTAGADYVRMTAAGICACGEPGLPETA